ncbi:hypothetical protein EMIHUDRAFT_238290 [Emiliania huxleyi CCMP1516]|uniref:CUE domain-containing protein n=2 Tax=Emiliania huxleyi TaxID=2903 RepID=A0A0D3JMQ7_EMIH1|nr:hypothetical protein EMIHUDRAFT_238290 [Emiliania huxleyi CCMP1516]EOD24792.1 hypothetical protein EMIHUDRAFT_238290 [Emiliania huxleyi CCMP1516]|eukprot:XP_005777221.1 hypothetical protein EMIHUDRAFT_238290 [Emiliania huxleyi CCMP1516]
MAASWPTIAPDEDIAALLERAQVSAPISDKVVPQLLAQDVGSVAALLEAGSSAMAGGDGAAGERAGGGVAHPSAPEVGPTSRLGMLDPPTHVSYNALRYNATELASNRRRLVGARGVNVDRRGIKTRNRATLDGLELQQFRL